MEHKSEIMIKETGKRIIAKLHNLKLYNYFNKLLSYLIISEIQQRWGNPAQLDLSQVTSLLHCAGIAVNLPNGFNGERDGLFTWRIEALAILTSLQLCYFLGNSYFQLSEGVPVSKVEETWKDKEQQCAPP